MTRCSPSDPSARTPSVNQGCSDRGPAAIGPLKSAQLFDDHCSALIPQDSQQPTVYQDSHISRLEDTPKFATPRNYDAHEAAEVRDYAEREDAAPAEGFGSLADRFRAALERREKP